MQQVLPNKEDIYEMLNLFFGDNMSAKYKTEPVDVAGKYAAIYVDSEGEPGAICYVDVPFAAYAGGAMTMMPPGPVQEAAASNDLSEMMVQNLYEIMNICTRLIINDDTRHLKLTEVRKTEEITEIVDVLLAAGNRGDYEINIPKYGVGTMSFLVS
ncbi:MAG: hypothetical protein AB8G77_00785 [Rhodothermales bacterium]